MQLYNHQQTIVDDDMDKCLLALGTGAGKTFTALHLAVGKTLVIAPKTVRDDRVWENNLDKSGVTNVSLTVISKEDFRLDKFPRIHYDTIIGDEAHVLAGVTPDMRTVKRKPVPKCSKIYEKFMEYIQEFPPKRLYLATATPIRSPMTVYGLGAMLGRKWNFYEFRDAFYFPVKKGYREFWIPKNDPYTKERLGKVVQKLGYTGRLDDYFDVPEQTYREHKVEQTADQKKAIKDIALEFPDPLVLTGKRHQIENGVLKGDDFSPDVTICDLKTEAILDFALEFPKMVIFTKYTQQIEKIKDALKDYKVLTLQGSTKDRENVLKDAEASDECIIIIQSQISAGYELPSFPVVVFASMSYSVVDRIQAEGRVLRANALKKNLYITLVTKGGVDEAVNKSINNKVDFSEKIYAQERG
jgi:superfamily II DNA or RNA helicase